MAALSAKEKKLATAAQTAIKKLSSKLSAQGSIIKKAAVKGGRIPISKA